MGEKKAIPHNPQEHKRFSWRLLLFTAIIFGAITITAVWVLSGLGIISSTWAIILSAIVTVFGGVIGLLPLVYPAKPYEPLTSQLSVQDQNLSSNIQTVNATNHSEINEPDQNIEEKGGVNRQIISANNNSAISRAKQNIKLT